MKIKIYIIAILLFGCCLMAFSQTYHTDKPRNGEGINSFLERNGYDFRRYKSLFIELNKGKFEYNNGLKKGVSYRFPLNYNEHPEMLFGLENIEITKESNELKGAVYYLVCGHGGPDPGAMSRIKGHDLCEDEYAYDIVLRLARELLQKGAKVYVIIQDTNDGIRDSQYLKLDEDETCMGEEIPLDQNQRLRQRVNMINKLYDKNRGKYQRAIFVHLDSRSKREQIDIFSYYCKGSSKGLSLSKTLQDTFKKKYSQYQPGRGFSGTIGWRNLYVLVATKPVGVFLELGNMQNARDQQRFIVPSNRSAVAKWIAEGIVKEYKKR